MVVNSLIGGLTELVFRPVLTGEPQLGRVIGVESVEALRKDAV